MARNESVNNGALQILLPYDGKVSRTGSDSHSNRRLRRGGHIIVDAMNPASFPAAE